MTIPPGKQIAALDDGWADAIIVVEEGEIDLVGRHGGTLRVGSGGILWLSDGAVGALRNPGSEPCVLSAVRRIP